MSNLRLKFSRKTYFLIKGLFMGGILLQRQKSSSGKESPPTINTYCTKDRNLFLKESPPSEKIYSPGILILFNTNKQS